MSDRPEDIIRSAAEAAVWNQVDGGWYDADSLALDTEPEECE